MPFNNLITVRNSSCGKVMFSQACVKNSVQGGCLPHCICWDTPPDTHTSPGHTPLPPPLPETATAVDGTHSTGMHSCQYLCLLGLCFVVWQHELTTKLLIVSGIVIDVNDRKFLCRKKLGDRCNRTRPSIILHGICKGLRRSTYRVSSDPKQLQRRLKHFVPTFQGYKVTEE